MIRHFYISNDLDDLEALEHDLENSDISRPQIHILSHNDAELEHHHLHQVPSVLRNDMVHTTKIGFGIGVLLAALILGTAYFSGLAETYLWVPVIFLSIIVLGFCTWEAGLIGIQRPHHEFRKFQKVLDEGKHLLIVDVSRDQEHMLEDIIAKHPNAESAGLGEPASGLVVGLQKQWHKFMRWAP